MSTHHPPIFTCVAITAMFCHELFAFAFVNDVIDRLNFTEFRAEILCAKRCDSADHPRTHEEFPLSCVDKEFQKYMTEFRASPTFQRAAEHFASTRTAGAVTKEFSDDDLRRAILAVVSQWKHATTENARVDAECDRDVMMICTTLDPTKALQLNAHDFCVALTFVFPQNGHMLVAGNQKVDEFFHPQQLTLDAIQSEVPLYLHEVCELGVSMMNPDGASVFFESYIESLLPTGDASHIFFSEQNYAAKKWGNTAPRHTFARIPNKFKQFI